MVGLALLALLICDVGGPGSTTQAQPVVDQFLRQLESAGGWPANTFSGAYHTEAEACAAYRDAHRPVVGVFSFADFLRLERSWGLTALAEMGGTLPKRYHLLVREGSYRSLKALQGKTVIVPEGIAPAFFDALVLETAVPAAKRFVWEATARPLQAVRAVARKQAEAAIVDDTVVAHLTELSLPETLVSLQKSPPLPGLTLATIGAERSAQPGSVAARLLAVLPEICAGEGEALCRSFGIVGFRPVDTKAFAALSKRYHRHLQKVSPKASQR